MLENHSWAAIKGSASAPYLNGTLLTSYAYANNYKGALSGNLHPSEPNYLWLEAGDNFGKIDDKEPAVNHQSTRDHLVTLLDDKGFSWRSYQEDMVDGTCPVVSSGNYAAKHNPMVFFDDVINYAAGNAPDPHAPGCVAHMKSFTQLALDLPAGAVGRYNFITPNLCNDGHNSCAPVSDPVKLSDLWLASWVPKILASPSYLDHGALFITWDEAEAATLNCVLGNCPIGMIVVSPLGKTGGYANSIAYDHSSTLKTVQAIFGLTPLLRHAGDASVTDLRDLFTTFP